MSGSNVALDTSVAIAVLAGQADDVHSQSIEQSVEEFLLPVPVVGELRYGALNSRRASEKLAAVEQLVGPWQTDSRKRPLDCGALRGASGAARYG